MNFQPQSTTPHSDSWRGYTLDELRMRKAYVQVKLEMEKASLFDRSQSVVKDGIMPVRGQSGLIVKKVLGALNYFDYIYLALKMGGRLMKLAHTFHKKEK